MDPIKCSLEKHGPSMLAILNEAIVNTTVLYDYEPRTIDNMVAWFAAKERGGFPVIGIEGMEDGLMGFATYGTFRDWPAYHHTVEHSVYVHSNHWNKGIGRILMEGLLCHAKEQGVRTMVGVIDTGNRVSISFHKKMGFFHAGTLREVGFKFNRWLDVAIYQKMIGIDS